MSRSFAQVSTWAKPTEELPPDSVSGIHPKAQGHELELVHRLHMLRRRYETTDEETYLLEMVDDLAPFHHARLARLRQAHAALIRRGEAVLSEPMSPSALRTAIHGVLQAIAEHDEAEGALLQDALLTDIGVGD